MERDNMSIVIRPADLTLDREWIIETLLHYLTPRSDDLRFDWLYKQNPHGAARVWMAIDPAHDTPVGMASAFPRRVFYHGQLTHTLVLGDFCIHDAYRSLGPALQLQKACLAAVDADRLEFCYDFPSTSMMAVYKRLRVHSCDQLLRLAKPLRVDRKIAELVKSPVISRGLSMAANPLLALGSRQATAANDRVVISGHEGPYGEEFSTLALQAHKRYGLCMQRSAAYLNWRYRDNPLYGYETLTARRDGDLLAYAIFTVTDEDATLVDLFGNEDMTVIRRLVGTVVSVLRKRRVITLSVPILASHPWVALLQSLGFKQREAHPMVVYPQRHPATAGDATKKRSWFFMYGDRDS